MLLATALLHSSHSNEPGALSNERLEFLGDAALGFIIGEWLFHRYPTATEGDLTWMRSAVVSRRALAGVARRIGLDQFLVLGRGESSRRDQLGDSVIGGALEAVIGARLVDRGLAATRRLVLRLLEPELAAVHPATEVRDAKSLFQNAVQARFHVTPRYRVRSTGSEESPFHHAMVFVEAQLVGEGQGRRRRDAEQAAAAAGLRWLAEQGL